MTSRNTNMVCLEVYTMLIFTIIKLIQLRKVRIWEPQILILKFSSGLR